MFVIIALSVIQCNDGADDNGQWSDIYWPIDHLHASPKEFISKLIAVTSWLDAVVAYANVLHPMEN